MHAALPLAKLLRTKLTPISVGIRNGLDVQIIDGLAENEQVVVYPNTKLIHTTLLDNMLVRTR